MNYEARAQSPSSRPHLGLLLLLLRQPLLHTWQPCCSRASCTHDVPTAAYTRFGCAHLVVAVFARHAQRVSTIIRRAAAAYADAYRRVEQASQRVEQALI